MPSGFLGTRADLIVDTVLICNLIAPVWAYLAAKKARGREFAAHMKHQMFLCGLLFVCLFTLEGHIRLSGGSGSLVAGSPYQGTALLKGVFLAHILPAVATYGVWLYLVVASFRRRNESLPGPFSRRHKKLGLVVIAGLVWTALSAIAVYVLGFALTSGPPST